MDTKKQMLGKLLVNCIPVLIGACLFRLGWAACLLIVPAQIAAALHNYLRGRGWRETLLLGALLALASAVGVQLCGRLYFHFVCYDGLGEVLFLGETALCAGLALLFALISTLARRHSDQAAR